jgi:histone deacetylase 1/2
MDRQMLIMLAIFQIEDQLVVSCFFGSGNASWSNKKQPIVALSSMTVEYKGAKIVAREIVWLQKLLLDLGLSVDVHVVIYYDNISSILLANNSVYHAKTKHIEVHYHY